MYKELEKYKTDDFVIEEMEVNGQKIFINLDKYTAGVGDLVNDLIKHKNKPFWMWKNYDSHLTELYIKMLNKITISHGF
jgi:hypothetical protein